MIRLGAWMSGFFALASFILVIMAGSLALAGEWLQAVYFMVMALYGQQLCFYLDRE